jgi:hypothetical protein
MAIFPMLLHYTFTVIMVVFILSFNIRDNVITITLSLYHDNVTVFYITVCTVLDSCMTYFRFHLKITFFIEEVLVKY